MKWWYLVLLFLICLLPALPIALDYLLLSNSGRVVFMLDNVEVIRRYRAENKLPRVRKPSDRND